MVKSVNVAALSRRMPTAGTLFLGIVVHELPKPNDGMVRVSSLGSQLRDKRTNRVLIQDEIDGWTRCRSHSGTLRGNPVNSRLSRSTQLPTLTQRYRVLELIASLSAHHTKECLRQPQDVYAQQVHKRYEPLVGHKSYSTGRSWFGFGGSGAVPDTHTPELMGRMNKRSGSSSSTNALLADGWNEHKKRDLVSKQHKYFFAINLYNSFDVIPDLFATMFRTAGVLGYHNVFVSIYENGSNDQTKALLRIFDALARVVGMRIIIRTSMRTRGAFNHRIEYLAEVRNAAMVPLHELRDTEGEIFDTVIFMNDILPCVDDVLELIWQSRRQNAGITCAADYMFHDDIGAPVFYDNWVARDINGTALENAPFEQIFHHTESEKRFMHHLPVQVQSCWNGIAVLDPAPFYNPPHVRFRMAKLSEGECSASECGLICNDYWNSGYGRIIMVPRVKLAYDKRVYDIIHPERRNLTAIRGYKRLGGLPDDPHTDPQDKNWYGPHDRLFVPEEDEVLNFQPGPKYVWCWGWDGAGDLDGPDVDPIWEEQLPTTYDKDSILIKHDRSLPGWQ